MRGTTSLDRSDSDFAGFRSSILSGGHQPMSDQEESVWVVFNGEIYNFPELRRELEGYGHVFRTKSDTEVIIHGYKQWGDDVLNRLNGMFGLAIWDVRQEAAGSGTRSVRDQADLLQDRWRPSVFRLGDARGSRDDAGQAEIDPTSLNLFLRYRYTPSPYTIFKGVRKLAPGTKLVVQNGTYEVSRWYQFKPDSFCPRKVGRRSHGRAARTLQAGDEAATDQRRARGLALERRRRFRAVACLDESEREFLANIHRGIRLELSPMTNWRTPRKPLESLGSKHTSVTITRSIFEEALPKIVACLEEPIAASSIVPMYFVCERARQDVKVALVGQGPDELFGGYRRHLGVRYGALVGRIAGLGARADLLDRCRAAQK